MKWEVEVLNTTAVDGLWYNRDSKTKIIMIEILLEAVMLLFIFLNSMWRNFTNVHQVSEVLIVVQGISNHKLVWKEEY